MGVLDRDEINAFTKEIVEAKTDAAKEVILAQLEASGAVKSVQRMTQGYKGSDNYTNVRQDLSFDISEVDPDKTIVLISCAGSNAATVSGYWDLNVTATKVSFSCMCNSSYQFYANIQVVEFY